MNPMDTIAIIPARGGSKSIPCKTPGPLLESQLSLGFSQMQRLDRLLSSAIPSPSAMFNYW
jgi:hypothetical protein